MQQWCIKSPALIPIFVVTQPEPALFRFFLPLSTTLLRIEQQKCTYQKWVQWFKLTGLPTILLVLGSLSSSAQSQKIDDPRCDTLTLGRLSHQAQKEFLEENREDAYQLFRCALERFAQPNLEIQEFIEFHHSFARALCQAGANELSLVHAQKELQLSKKIFQHPKGLAKSYGRYALILLANNLSDSAIFYYKTTSEIKKTEALGTPYPIYNHIGLAYAQMGLHDSALTYYHKCLANINMGEFYLSVLDNVVRSHWKSGNKKQVELLMPSFSKKCLDVGNEKRQFKYHLLVSEIYLDYQEVENSTQHLLLAEKLSSKIDDSRRNEWILKLEELKLENARTQQKWLLADSLGENVRELKSGLNERNKKFLELILKSQPNYNAAMNNMKQLVAKLEADNRKAIRRQIWLSDWVRKLIIFISLFTFPLIAISLFFRFKQRQMKKEKELVSLALRAKREQLDKLIRDVDNKRNDIERLTLYLRTLQDVSEDVKLALEESIDLDDEERKAALKKLLIDSRSKNQMRERMDILNGNVDQVSQEFLNRLKQAHPQLTTLEVELCSLVKAGLNNQEIARVRKITVKSVRMGKYRLKKKLELSEQTNLEDFIRGM